MQKRIYLLALCAVALSAGSFLLAAAGSSHAAPPDKDVVVVNTPSNPVPVQMQGPTNVAGSVSVSNTPNVLAQQSGPWAQTIVNTESNPVPVRAVGETGQKPFQKFVQLDALCGQNTAHGHFSVPAGKRLVIERVALAANLEKVFGHDNGVESAELLTTSNAGDGQYPLDFHARQSPNGDPRYVCNDSMLAFADAQTDVYLSFEFDEPVGLTENCGSLVPVAGTISGHLIDMP